MILTNYKTIVKFLKIVKFGLKVQFNMEINLNGLDRRFELWNWRYRREVKYFLYFEKYRSPTIIITITITIIIIIIREGFQLHPMLTKFKQSIQTVQLDGYVKIYLQIKFYIFLNFFYYLLRWIQKFNSLNIEILLNT